MPEIGNHINSQIYLKSQSGASRSLGIHYAARCQSKLNSLVPTKVSISLWQSSAGMDVSVGVRHA